MSGLERRYGGAGIRRGIRGSDDDDPYLLNYAVGLTFTRASEAAAYDPRPATVGWYDLVTPWPGVNVARILPDGSIFIEGARTNITTAGLGSWNLANATRAQVTGPDGALSAYEITDASAAVIGVTSHNSFTIAGATQYVWSCRVKKDLAAAHIASMDGSEGGGGSGIFRAQINPATGETVMRAISGMTAGSVGSVDAGGWWVFWVRATTTAPATTFVITLAPAQSGVINTVNVATTGATAFALPQCEADVFASSPIRVAGAAATRAVDVASYADGSILDVGRWSVVVVPGFASTQLGTGLISTVFARTALTNGLYFEDTAGTKRVRIQANGVVVRGVVCAWAAHASITLTVDWTARTLTILGCTSGDGTYSLSGTDTWATAADTVLRVGSSSAAGINPAFAVIGRPVAA